MIECSIGTNNTRDRVDRESVCTATLKVVPDISVCILIQVCCFDSQNTNTLASVLRYRAIVKLLSEYGIVVIVIRNCYIY